MPLDVTAALAAIREHNGAALDIERLRRDYFSNGCVIIRNAMDPLLLSEMRDRFRHFFAAIIRREGGDAPPDADIDQLHDAAAAAIGPERARHFLTMGRDFPAFSAIISAPALLGILKNLFQTADLQTIADSNVCRIDRPGSAATNLDWHQDYPYNMLAQSAATVWIPINPVTQGMGCPRVAPGVQTIFPIEYNLGA
jgi:ectoine hydroxylase-related dioxygenase (phytanoyl-CoA dioxygenase family)